MKTLKECIESVKCRKGAAAGTTKRGAYWLACEPIEIRRYGGDGIGNSGADCTNYLELRHYRSGEVAAILHGDYWHQNGAGPDDWEQVPALLACTTIEFVIVTLKGVSFQDQAHVFSDSKADKLTDALAAIGMAEQDPSPDQE